MKFPKKVEQWRKLVELEARSLPIDLILAIIEHESRGVTGKKAGTRTKHCVNLPYQSGGVKKLCHAHGLMQVIPRNYYNWNRSDKQPKATIENITGKGPGAARFQIKVGTYILKECFNTIHLYDPVLFPWPKGNMTDDQIKFALAIYAWGFERLKPKLDTMTLSNWPLTFNELKRHWPKLGEPKNRPLYYATKIFNRFRGLAPITVKKKILMEAA